MSRFVAPLLCAFALSGCVSSLFTQPPPETYALTGPTEPLKVSGSTSAQILVPQPTALKILDSQRIVVGNGPELAYYPKAQYPDTLPNILQARIIETIEKTGRAKGVGRPGEGLSIDYQLLTNIRTFQFHAEAPRSAEAAVFVRIMNDRNGRVVGAKLFRAEVPVGEDTAVAAVAGLNAALDQILAEIVSWTLTRI